MTNKFEPGEIQYSDGARKLEVDEFLARHLRGDWGDINDSDKALNMNALRKGLRLMSDYEISPGQWLMIITNNERTMTAIQLYDEYLQEDGEMTAADIAACIESKESWNRLTPKELREIKASVDFDLPPKVSPIQKDIVKLYYLQKKIVWWAKLLILIGFPIILVQFIIWLLLR